MSSKFQGEILRNPVEITTSLARFNYSGLRVVFTNDAIPQMSEDDDDGSHFITNFFEDAVTERENRRYGSKIVWTGYHHPGSLILLRAPSRCEGSWVATIPMGGVKNDEEKIAAANRGMFNALVVADTKAYRIDGVSVEIAFPLDPHAFFCAIAEYRQGGGKIVPIQLFFNRQNTPAPGLGALMGVGRFGQGALPTPKREIRIISPGCSLEDCFKG